MGPGTAGSQVVLREPRTTDSHVLVIPRTAGSQVVLRVPGTTDTQVLRVPRTTNSGRGRSY